jgi:hypothetical protein
MIKTALAFVVAKARLRRRKRPLEAEKAAEASTVSIAASSTVNQFNREIEKRIRVGRLRPSLLDGFFRCQALQVQDCPCAGIDGQAGSLLQRHGGTKHLHHMFQAAFTLAKCAVLQSKSSSNSDSCCGSVNSDTAAALIGATAHLAYQLQLFLSTTFSPSFKFTSSKSQADEEKTTNRQELPPPRVDDGMAIVQSWIRSTLLHFSSSAFSSSSSSNAINTDDIEAAFAVYQIVVPQLAILSPPVIAHIFQVVTRLIRELYDDKLVLPAMATSTRATSSTPNDSVTTMDYLATCALKLLELCWTVDTANPSSSIESPFSGNYHDVEEHRSFLLLSLQETLGDLLIPLSYDEVSRFQHYEPAHGTLDEQQLQPTMAGGTAMPVTITNARTHGSKDSNRSNAGRHMMNYQGYLHPDAKLIMRMAVYRLLMLQ